MAATPPPSSPWALRGSELHQPSLIFTGSLLSRLRGNFFNWLYFFFIFCTFLSFSLLTFTQTLWPKGDESLAKSEVVFARTFSRRYSENALPLLDLDNLETLHIL